VLVVKGADEVAGFFEITDFELLHRTPARTASASKHLAT
jgi:hypothetical protein